MTRHITFKTTVMVMKHC